MSQRAKTSSVDLARAQSASRACAHLQWARLAKGEGEIVPAVPLLEAPIAASAAYTSGAPVRRPGVTRLTRLKGLAKHYYGSSRVCVVAQVSRSPRQVQLRRMLRGCDIVGLAPDDSHEVGAVVGKASTSDVVDAHLAIVAFRRQATVLTSDVEDLRHLSDQLPTTVRIQRI